MDKKDILRKEILKLTAEYYQETFAAPAGFIPGNTKINYAGRVFDQEEIQNSVEASLDFWLTNGRYTETFEKELAKFLGVQYCLTVNSGSSANLLAVTALTSPRLKERKLNKGDEVITLAAAFPTTVNPIIQNGLIPVFIDISLETCNADVQYLEEALSPKTKAVIFAHTLGNPFDLEAVKKFCQKHHLWLIEDNCDALGSRYDQRLTGTIGDIGTSSFYPPHQITMGEGGAIYTNNSLLKVIIESFRDWGRDCWCASGQDNTCNKRFSWELGDLPKGYDHKYTYSHFGYNLKITEMQAAIGCAQLKKLPSFVQKRKENFNYLRNELKDLENLFILPKATEKSDPCWFGFLLTFRNSNENSRSFMVNKMEAAKIQTRMLFGGNLIRQPLFNEMRQSQKGYRVVGDLKNTDKVMQDSFWMGVYPKLTLNELEYVVRQIKQVAQSL